MAQEVADADITIFTVSVGVDADQGLMEQIEAEFSTVKVFSLPSVGDANMRRHIELGVKGEPGQVSAAFEKMLAGLDRFQAEYQRISG